MEPLTLGLGLAMGLAYLATRKKGATPPALPAGSDAAGFPGFAPEAQGKAWYMTCSIPWTQTGSITDSAGRVALTYRGQLVGDPGDAKRMQTDAWLRGMMAKDYRIIVSDQIVIPSQGAAPYLAFLPSGFPVSSIPKEWGPMVQLYAPAPGWLEQMNQGQAKPLPGPIDADPFNEIPDPGVRQKVRDLYNRDDASIRDLESTANDLEKYGWKASADKLRQRAQSLRIQRSLDAKQAGGYLYLVRMNDLPINVAQWYGGKKPGVLGQMVKLNPTVAANKWSGWVEGAEVLLPIEWGDPMLKGFPPLASGNKSAPAPGGGAGGGGGGNAGGGSPYYPYGQNPGTPTPKNPKPGQPAPNVWYGPGGEGPFTGPAPAQNPFPNDENTIRSNLGTQNIGGMGNEAGFSAMIDNKRAA